MGPVFPFALDLPPERGRLSQVLHQQLRAAILDGRLAPGALLPSTRGLAAELGLARNTVVAAYELLAAEGYVLARPGAKARVAELAARRGAQAVQARAFGDGRLHPRWRDPDLGPAAPRVLPERSFRLGIPEHRHFPHALWRRLTAQTLRRWAKQPFAYPPTEGLPELREAIAQHVAYARAVVCAPENVCVTSGAQQAFDLLARILVSPGRTRVAVEEPGYPPLRAAFAAAGAELVPVPVDDEGLCVEQLPPGVAVISVTPSHQSPTGVALSRRRRLALLAYARREGAVIIEDDYDGEFRFSGRPLDALQTLDRDSAVFYVGTFSKSLFPALRKGFIVAPSWARASLTTAQHCTGAHCDSLSQAVLASFIREGHLLRHVRAMQKIYEARRAALLAGLHGELSPWLEPIPSEAGLHLAARVRDPALAAAIYRAARRWTPGAEPLDTYALAPPLPPALAFGYGVIEAEAIAPALAQLSNALASVQA